MSRQVCDARHTTLSLSFLAMVCVPRIVTGKPCNLTPESPVTLDQSAGNRGNTKGRIFLLYVPQPYFPNKVNLVKLMATS